ncbi:putative SNARE associated Golgi protein family [Hibiscus syriacus]|uniref:SNARE associated Golgi protein family n=1 Tax=Hibiscus syriacus TaxID=106335 RepID=A0A6A2Y0C5_HIBSY|nr:putative SNARE associated Golgi protein family [Hibiscus syriacus]
METEPLPSAPAPASASAIATAATTSHENRYRSIFDLPKTLITPKKGTKRAPKPALLCPDGLATPARLSLTLSRTSAPTSNPTFIVSIIAGKDTVKEEEFDELTMDSYKDFEVSSISGSEDEADKGAYPRNDASKGLIENIRKKLFILLQTGERVSIWKSLILNESESVLYENDKEVWNDNPGCLRENEVIERLKALIQEPKDNVSFRIVLLSSGWHFAGCVFNGNRVVAHKTFHRYVVRAKAGKKQSSKDAMGKAAHSAGASLRRHNELALKKEIQELLASWKSYFEASSCVFVHAPSSNRNVFFNGDKPCFSHQFCAVRNVPLTVCRPTLKEAKRIYSQLTQVSYEVEEKEIPPGTKEDMLLSSSANNNGNLYSHKEELGQNLNGSDASKTPSRNHKSGDAQKVMELLEQGLDPCIKDQRGRTPYMLANEKEVRNMFRRFMASNLEKWDWNSAKVPSALTKEMEESQATKQAEKDSKRKARAKELKKLRRAREKKAQAEATQSQSTVAIPQNQATGASVSKGRQSQPVGAQRISKEEELKIEREKRAAAAERRIAATAAAASCAQDAQGSSTTEGSTTSIQPKSGVSGPGDISCSCCNTSLAGKVPFHRYNYKYCSTSCMHVHREILEDT